MEPYMERVINEKQDLDAKINKLSAFITGRVYVTLPEGECWDLLSQIRHMRAYSADLGSRIRRWMKG